MNKHLGSLLIATALGAFLIAGCVTPPEGPLNGLERLKNYESRRASSSATDWRNGNGDSRPIKAGETLTVAELDGPGLITHIWFTIAHEAKS